MEVKRIKILRTVELTVKGIKIKLKTLVKEGV